MSPPTRVSIPVRVQASFSQRLLKAGLPEDVVEAYQSLLGFRHYFHGSRPLWRTAFQSRVSIPVRVQALFPLAGPQSLTNVIPNYLAYQSLLGFRRYFHSLGLLQNAKYNFYNEYQSLLGFRRYFHQPPNRSLSVARRNVSIPVRVQALFPPIMTLPTATATPVAGINPC